MKWHKYTDLESIRHLRNEGRELIGKVVFLTEKRDGSNISIWLDEEKNVKISSHNMEQASEDLINKFKLAPEYNKAVELLKQELEFDHHYILYGELIQSGKGPTRIEPTHKYSHWVLFDIWDCEEEKYLSYNYIFQKAYHHKIPIVKVIQIICPKTIEELQTNIKDNLKLCKRHKREGFVGKLYAEQIMFKEKIDLPKLSKFPSIKLNEVQLPPMPEDKILRSLQHAFDEVGEENWKNTKITMPIVARHFETEAREHNFSTPRNMYQLFLSATIEQLKIRRETNEN